MKKHYLIILLSLYALLSFGQKDDSKGVTVENILGDSTSRRLALVIGNKDYSFMKSLKNPVNDAIDIAKTLEGLGFAVSKYENTDYRGTQAAILKFKKNLRESDIVVFYYSGHGMGFNGQNYLLPVDANISCLDEIERDGISINKFSADIRRVRNSFIFLDACRNIPNLYECNDTRRAASQKGLIRPQNPPGSMIVFATREGDTADDNPNDRNGLFTSELLKNLTQPNLGIREIIDRTSVGVRVRSNGRQNPARYDELLGDFIFIKNINRVEPHPVNPVVIKTYAAYPLTLKIGVAGVSMASALGAVLIRNKFNSKRSALDELNRTLPQVNGNLISQADKETWDRAYQEVQSSRKVALFNSLVSVTILSAGYEATLMLSKRKTIHKNLMFRPAEGQLGVGLNYKF